jgi:hypothetical protein
MNKKYLLEARDYIYNKIIYFGNQYRNNNILETSFLNWNVRDVIGHINGWIKWSEDIIESIKVKQISKDAFNVDVEIFNKSNYEKYKIVSLDNVINESKIILDKYKSLLNLFDDNDLLSKDFQTGFDFPAWKYMTMDLIYHPIMHILYYYLKTNDYNEFIKEIKSSKKYFMVYSENNIKEYNFKDFFESKEDMTNKFNKLKEIVKDNEFLNEVIKVNLGQ